MKLNINSLLLFFLSTFAPLPIFFDLSNLSIIFVANTLDTSFEPLIPLPISFVFFVLVFFINLPLSLKKFSYKRFVYLFCLILLLTFLSTLNAIPFTRFIQFTLPLSLILSIPAIVGSFNIYSAYSFILSLSAFSIVHLFYNFFGLNNSNCSYNCNIIFLDYEIYHGSVGFPDVILFVVSASLLLSQSLKKSILKYIFLALSFFLLFYAFFVGRTATIFAILIAIVFVTFKETIRILSSFKINKTFFILSFLTLLCFVVYGEAIFGRIDLLYRKIFDVSGISSPRIIIYNYYLEAFLENPSNLIFGGLSKDIDGHNFIISTLSNIGLIGLSILVSCYWIGFLQLKERFKLSLNNLNILETFALNLSFSTILVGNFINDALTQTFNVIVMFVFLILLISILENKKTL